MKALKQLGRKQTRAERALRRADLRLCVVCGERKPAAEFQARKRARVLNLFCNDCGRLKAQVRAALHPEWLPRKARRRAALTLLIRFVRRRHTKKKGGEGMAVEDEAVKMLKLPDRIAAIIGKTFAEAGDAFTLADDEALMMIRDLLLEIDDTLVERNKNKRLAKR